MGSFIQHMCGGHMNESHTLVIIRLESGGHTLPEFKKEPWAPP